MYPSYGSLKRYILQPSTSPTYSKESFCEAMFFGEQENKTTARRRMVESFFIVLYEGLKHFYKGHELTVITVHCFVSIDNLKTECLCEFLQFFE